MFKRLLTILFTLIFLIFTVVALASVADIHKKSGISCADCHQTKKPKEGAKVRNEQCLSCHESYDELAKKTAKLQPNPHYTHLGNVRCSDCHSGHKQSHLMCNDCHKFNLKM